MQDSLTVFRTNPRLSHSLLPRAVPLTTMPGKAKVVTGMRRAGKTWFCYQYMRELLSQDVEKERLLYLNFEDERLLPFAAPDFQDILETYYRKFPAFKTQHCYLFLDEALVRSTPEKSM